RSLAGTVAWMTRHFRCVIEFEARLRDYHRTRYEDLVAGRVGGLAATWAFRSPGPRMLVEAGARQRTRGRDVRARSERVAQAPQAPLGAEHVGAAEQQHGRRARDRPQRLPVPSHANGDRAEDPSRLIDEAGDEIAELRRVAGLGRLVLDDQQ